MALSEDTGLPATPRPEHGPPPREAKPAVTTATADSNQNTQQTWQDALVDRAWPIVLFLGLFVLAYVAWKTPSCPEECTTARPALLLPLLTVIWVALLFAWFVHCFTGEAYDKRTKAIEFAYFFMVLSFLLVAIMIADIGKARKFGVIEGCIENLTRGNTVPVQCDYPKPMWLRPPPQTSELDKKGNGKSTPKPDEKGQTIGEGKGAPKTEDKSALKPGDKARTKTAEQSAAKSEDKKEDSASVEAYVPDFDARKVNYSDNRNYHYLLNIGGHLDRLEPKGEVDCAKCEKEIFAVRGGLPVPVYFILLALIGGAISLAKNVPVIQKRSDVGWQGTATEPRLAPGEVRELLLFQVLQFVSAPLLAVIAYHTIKPESFGSTVALGFIVGFSSDQILALVRSMVKGTQPTGEGAPPAGSIQGKVLRAGKPVANATVALESTTLTTRTDSKGEFMLVGVPLKSQPYLLKVTAAEKSKQLDVRVSEPAPVKLVDIDLG